MEYYYTICEAVRSQYPKHGQDQERIVSVSLNRLLQNHTENTLNSNEDICNKIGLSIMKCKNKPLDFSDSNFLLTDVVPNNNACAGKYLDCKHSEISQNDLNIFLSNIETNKINTTSVSRPVYSTSMKYIEEPKCHEEKNLIENINGASNIKGNLTGNYTSNVNATSTINVASKTAAIGNTFKTAHQELIVQKQKYGTTNQGPRLLGYGNTKRTVGSKYKKPELLTDKVDVVSASPNLTDDIINIQDDRLRNIDENMIKLICNEIMHKFKPINWEDIAGLEYAKSSIQEAVVWPILRPDIFTGLRRPPRGILLFGPPGTGKTLIGKCIASQSKSTFFSISASSLTSKWIGEGEKMVRALFAVATVKQPSVIFIDEIDSLLCQRTETEHESSRRIKTEFLVQLDGAGTKDNERLLIVGATNRPQELDEAARRRFVRRLYIPLPELDARIQIIKNLLATERNDVIESEYLQIGHMSDGYSAADMESLCREASLEPIRSIPAKNIPTFNEKQVRSVNYQDFLTAFKRVRTSVSPDELLQYEKWNNIFGANNSK